jgi:hypothetical protein
MDNSFSNDLNNNQVKGSINSGISSSGNGSNNTKKSNLFLKINESLNLLN